MAIGTQYSAWSAWKLPSGASVKRRVRTYYTWTTSETATTFSIAIQAYAQMQGGSATMGGNTVTVSATGQSSVSNTFKFVYGETTLHNPVNKTYTWKKTTAAQTVTVKSTYKVASSSLFAGTYVASGTFTIPALAPATISFDANNGTGTVPTAISTYVGVANTIPPNSLTRIGYTFNGWNTASDGSGTAYATGSTIAPIGDVTLYAQWQTAYVKPEIQNLLAFRTADASGGASPTVTSTGETGFCKFELVGGADYTFTSATVQFGTAPPISMTKSGTTLYGYSEVGSIAEASEYTVKITVVVTGVDGISRTYTDLTYISKSVPIFDISSDGKCFSFFTPATDGLANPKVIVNGELELDPALSIANGGTGATTAAEARANLGITGGGTKTLLWVNASPTSRFGAQTISLDLSEYDFVEVVYDFNPSFGSLGQIVERCEVGHAILAERIYNADQSGALENIFRGGEGATTSGYIFGGGYSKVAGSSHVHSGYDLYIVPCKIYGIKEG